MNDNEPLTPRQFAKRLNDIRVINGWTIGEFAQEVDLPRETIRDYVLGKTLPNDEDLARLAKALDTTPNTLLSGSFG